ncbi:MAG: cytidylate kinase-like family protein [Pseudomonadales bacterium]|nr:cytidylate kinase-like family protein [Pseudomonadales bacterium]
MTIISISRGTLAGATLVAEKLASDLQLPCVSREVVIDAARDGGINESNITEQMDALPTSLFNNYSKERDTYLWYMRSALCQRATQGSYVYHGNACHLLLANISSMLRVNVVAPMPYRCKAVMENQQLDLKAAEKYIQNIDKWRSKWVRHLYGVDWHDPSLYDLVINLEKLSVDEACQLISQTAALPQFSRNDKTQAELTNMALVSRVSAELAKGGELFTGQIKLSAENNILTISGKARSKEACDVIHHAAKQSIGDAELHFEVVAAMDDVSWKI